MKKVTYEKFWNENVCYCEDYNGRVYERVVGWQYQVLVNGETPEQCFYGGRFDLLKDLKRHYPTATRKKTSQG